MRRVTAVGGMLLIYGLATARGAGGLRSGVWTEDGGWIGGQAGGKWTYRDLEPAVGSDCTVEFDLRIDTASTCRKPTWESAGWVWAHYQYNANIGGYEAGLLLRRQGEEFYRVMFSTSYQEVLLWSTRGGFLHVAPWELETGRIYRISAAARGPHLTVTIDGRKAIDYWDRAALLTAGGAALGLHEGAALFRNVRVSALPAFDGTVPPHRPDFRFRDWNGARWAWDGAEPIFMVTGCYGRDAKLVPGYNAQLNMYWYWINYGGDAFYANKLKEFRVKEEGERLRFEVIATDKGKKTWLTGRTDVTLTYDAEQHRYVFDHVSDLIIPEGHTLGFTHPVEFTDPVIMRHVGSASTHGVQWDTPHPWSVYRHADGTLYKIPHNHCNWQPGYNEPGFRAAKGQCLAPKGGFWAIVGDPVANPVFIVQDSSAPDSEFHTELCGWGFDVHMQWYPVKQGGTLQPGAYSVTWRLTSVDGEQGDKWLGEAGFCAPGDLDAKLLVYTGGVGHTERFDKVVKHASPFYEYAWGDGSLQDTTVGHGDSLSLKLTGPRRAQTTTGASQYTEPVQTDTPYEVSAWVKTDRVRGEGPGMSFGGQVYVPGIIGTSDWQRIGFVCRPNPPLYIVPIRLFNSGSGTVWFDDFRIRAMAAGESPVPPVAGAPKPVAGPNAPSGRVLAWSTASDARDPGRTLLDLSGRGNHGRLEGTAAMVDEGGKRVVEVDGQAGYVTGGEFLFEPPQALSFWIKPGVLSNSTSYVATGGAWNRAWSLFLTGAPQATHMQFRPWGRRFVLAHRFPQDAWTHLAFVDDGETIRIYLNGAEAEAREELSGSGDWTVLSGPLVLGARLEYGNPSWGFTGCLADCGYWNQALDAAAVKALFDRGPR